VSARLPYLNDIEELKCGEYPDAERKERVERFVLTAARSAEDLRGKERIQSRKIFEPIRAKSDITVAYGAGDLRKRNAK